MQFNKVESFEHACEILGEDANKLPEVSHLEVSDAEYQIAVFKLTKIIKAINNGWKADRSDRSQWKYFPVFVGSGSGFSYHYYGCADSSSYVGARLELCSPEAVRYAADRFLDLYSIIING